MDGFPYIFNVVNLAWANENDEYNTGISLSFLSGLSFGTHMFLVTFSIGKSVC